MNALIDALPLAAAVLAVPQFIPQLVRLARTSDTDGVSWPWAALTSVNNAAWTDYFALAGDRSALVPSISAAVLAGLLGLMLARRGARPTPRAVILVGLWAVTLVVIRIGAGAPGLGVALIAAFFVQVAPSVWSAYHADRASGISVTTWVLILAELLCWLIFGLARSDPRLIVLGCTGVAGSLLVIARTVRAQLTRRAPSPGAPR